uniref:Activin types I and II receptor domain-containing protein n=2 Tax=Parascaris univalens TaxID=6257 RepID=A0A915BP95_PARUN
MFNSMVRLLWVSREYRTEIRNIHAMNAKITVPSHCYINNAGICDRAFYQFPCLFSKETSSYFSIKMNGLLFGLMFTSCFSLVSTLKCVDGGEYKSGESKKRNVQCGDVKFCANFTYRGRFATTLFTRYGCSRNDDNITTGLVRGTLCKQNGCRRLTADTHPYMPTDAKVCCCNEDYCNDGHGKMNESVKGAGKRRCKHKVVKKSLEKKEHI